MILLLRFLIMIIRYGSNTAKMTDDPLHDDDDIGGMIAAADHLLSATAGEKGFVDAANAGDKYPLYWIRRLTTIARIASMTNRLRARGCSR